MRFFETKNVVKSELCRHFGGQKIRKERKNRKNPYWGWRRKFCQITNNEEILFIQIKDFMIPLVKQNIYHKIRMTIT